MPCLATCKLLLYLLDHTRTNTFHSGLWNHSSHIGCPLKKNHNENTKTTSPSQKRTRQHYLILQEDNVALRNKTPYQLLKTQRQNTMGGGKHIVLPSSSKTKIFHFSLSHGEITLQSKRDTHESMCLNCKNLQKKLIANFIWPYHQCFWRKGLIKLISKSAKCTH